MIRIERKDKIDIISFTVDKINALITDEIREGIDRLFNNSFSKVIIDLKGVEYIDSSGFGVFLSLLKTATNNKGVFKLCGISAEVMELFKLLQLHNVFTLYSNLDECLDSF